MEAPASLLSELKRRRVFRALIGYAIAAFAVLQIIEPVMHGLHWPDAVLSYVVVGLAAGFPIIVALAWVFDVKAGALERASPTATRIRGTRLGLLLLAIGAFAAVPGLLWYFVWRKPARPAVADSAGAVSISARRRVPVRGSPSRGPADAPVTIVEFGDFQCPYTKLTEPRLQKLFEKYPDKIRLVWMDAPAGVHLDADDAAGFAREALRQKGPEGFWRVHDKLLPAAPSLGKPALERIAVEEGLDPGAIRAALVEGRYRTRIDADVDVAHAVGYMGTPTFFINGRFTSDGPELLEKTVSEELADARRRMAAGVPAGALYDDFQRDADRTPTPVERMALPDPGRRPARGGPASSAVLVHEFCDLSLLKCAWIEPPLRKTLASYGDEVRLVWWDVSDPQQALSARVMTAAAAAGNDGFWQMHDAILARQWRERFEEPPPETLSPAVLRAVAKESGIEMDLYDYAVAVGVTDDENQQLTQARSLGRAGLIVIDGDVYAGFAPPHLWRAAIDRALARRR
jgi:protein-disulfide isomerase